MEIRNPDQGRLARVAVVGARGQLGSALAACFGPQAIRLDRPELDLEDPVTIAATLDRHRPSFVISTAAFHRVDACEREPQNAFAVNAVGTGRLAGACAEAGIGFAFVSTDYVFDGTLRRAYRESDEARPVQAYGISKLAGEHLTLRSPEAYVFRTSGLFGQGGARGKGPSFAERIIGQARRGEPIRVVNDVTFSPSYAPHVAAFMRQILEGAPPGIYHTTNAGWCTWYQFAQAALRAAGCERPIEPVSQRSFDTSILRPPFSALEHEASRRHGVAAPPPWLEGLTAYIAAEGLGKPAGA